MKRIRLTKGYFAIIDNEDFERVSKLKWSAVGTTHIYARHGYADTVTKKVKNLYLHRFILNTTCQTVDHINGKTLDCRRANLREADQSINVRNRKARGSSKYMGVCFHMGRTWLAKIVVNKKQLHLGSFKEERYAALVYNEAAKHFNLAHISRLNKISEKYSAKHLHSIRQLPIFTSSKRKTL